MVFGLCARTNRGTDATDADAAEKHLSYVGQAAFNLLTTKHKKHRHSLWNVSSGKVIGEVHHTPRDFWKRRKVGTNDPQTHHSDWFPQKMCDIMSKTQVWCDVMSLSPPDGLFLEKVNEALKTIAKTAESKGNGPIYIRFMFGHIIAQPVNNTAVVEQLTKGISKDANIRLWVGAWRKKQSWNHAKLIAVDGRYLHTGGHNCWDSDYLQEQPVHDLSLELEGKVTQDAHSFANWQWDYLRKSQSTVIGQFIACLPDHWLVPSLTRVTVTEYPPGEASVFPPQYSKSLVPKYDNRAVGDAVPIISIGKQGNLMNDEPSEDALVALFDSAKTSIRCAQQDIGPRIIGATRIPVPGFSWPHMHLKALGRALQRGVDVEFVLSNPGAQDLGGYSNGWKAEEVAAEVVRSIPQQFPDANDSSLRKIVAENLRICFIRGRFGNTWQNGNEIALHSKHVMIDDICTYIGSENLYAFDMAEWGVVIDHPEQTRKFMKEFWTPLWGSSYRGDEFGVRDVIDGLKISRDAPSEANKKEKATAREIALAKGPMPKKSELYEEEEVQ